MTRRCNYFSFSTDLHIEKLNWNNSQGQVVNMPRQRNEIVKYVMFTFIKFKHR